VLSVLIVNGDRFDGYRTIMNCLVRCAHSRQLLLVLNRCYDASPMAEVGITAIIVGAILFALGFFPGLLPALMERFQGLLDRFVPSRGRIHKFQTDLPLHQRRLS
jgi:hypothetical protein